MSKPSTIYGLRWARLPAMIWAESLVQLPIDSSAVAIADRFLHPLPEVLPARGGI